MGQVAPSRGRELKREHGGPRELHQRVAPSRGRELKPGRRTTLPPPPRVAPSRGRELKRERNYGSRKRVRSPPRGGVS